MVRLDHLVQQLEGKLNPVDASWLAGGDGRRRELSGVHISELSDPTTYLEGSELLLTTGMGFSDSKDTRQVDNLEPAVRIDNYVARLARRDIAGLALSLGPHIFSVPAELKAACEKHKLPLFSVPAAIPFLSISRVYWDLVAEAGAKDLSNAVSAQAGLTRVATSANARAEIIKLLARLLGGWATLLPTDASEANIWPLDAGVDTVALRSELGRLNMAGPHSAATFRQGDDEVVTYPIAVGRHITGFLAIGLKRRLTSAERHVVLSACGLLALDSRNRRAALGRNDDLRSAVMHLVLSGHDVAARDLAAQLGFTALPARVRCIVLGGFAEPIEALHTILQRATGGAAWVESPWQLRRDGLHIFIEDASVPASGLEAVLPPTAWGVQTRTVTLADVPSAIDAATARRRLGRLHGPRHNPASRSRQIAQQVHGVLTEPGHEAHLETVRSYLRHRGRWEEVSKELALHRNTVRNRMTAIREVLAEVEADSGFSDGLILEDPDVSAHLWLLIAHSPVASF